MDYLDLTKFSPAEINSQFLKLKIEPFQYLDGRNPRLPRKSSKKYALPKDTSFYFNHVFKAVTRNADTGKFKIDIIVYNGLDRLGTADLDNYCKAILDGITTTKKVWKDDRQVDQIIINRVYTRDKFSSIAIEIKKIA